MSGSSSSTIISEFRGHHYWTIKNWKSWVGCSEKDATIWSNKFCITNLNEEGLEQKTVFRVKCFPKKNTANGKDMLAFRLVCLSETVPKGSFHFKTVRPTLFGGERIVSKFKSLPLDAANRWMTCVRYHSHDDLTIKVKIVIVSTTPKMEEPAAERSSRRAGSSWMQFWRVLSAMERFPPQSPHFPFFVKYQRF